MTAAGEVRASADRQAPALRRSGRLILVLSLAWLVASSAWAAAIRFAPIFNDGVVLQCEMAVNVWGWAAPGVRVELRLDGRAAATAVADASGRWLAVLPAQSPGGAHTLEAVAGAEVIKVSEVWFGEVWLASGQSNMVQPLKNSHGGEEHLALTLPGIRFVRVPERKGVPVERDLTAADLAWQAFAPPQNQRIAAVAFYFAEQLQQATGRKIGIVQSSFGGTHAHVWTPLWALEERAELRHYAAAHRKSKAAGKSKEQWLKEVSDFEAYYQAEQRWQKTREGTPPVPVPRPGQENPYSSVYPSTLFENMIAPLAPFTMRGVIWYQGEANAGGPAEYRVLFPALIRAWRQTWGRADWPFLFVQLASYSASAGDWPGLRAAQAFVRDTVPHTGMALAIDCGEKGEIHPRNKQPVGARLAQLALAQVYGQDVVSRGALLDTVTAEKGRVRVDFRYCEKGLRTSDGKPEIPGFEVAGVDGGFQAAHARVVGSSSVELVCEAIPEPVAVRYAWAGWVEPPVTLQNGAGLPAEPFSTAVRQERP
jgi:sialate O-acetylesterase